MRAFLVVTLLAAVAVASATWAQGDEPDPIDARLKVLEAKAVEAEALAQRVAEQDAMIESLSKTVEAADARVEGLETRLAQHLAESGAADGDAGGGEDLGLLRKRILRLEAQVDYLRGREDALRDHIVLRNQERAKMLRAGVARIRTQGFTQRAIPADSRESLLALIDGMAADLTRDPPALSEDEVAVREMLAKPLK